MRRAFTRSFGLMWFVAATLLCNNLYVANAVAQDGQTSPPRLTGELRLEGDFTPLTARTDGSAWRVPLMTEVAVMPPLEVMRVALLTDAPLEAGSVTLEVDDYRISPSSVVVAPGTKIVLEHKGVLTSEVLVTGRETASPVELSKASHTEQVVVSRQGLTTFVKAHYPFATSYVIVAKPIAEAALVARGTGRAAFDLGEVPAGKYTLRVYYRGRPIHEREVKVGPVGETRLEFLLELNDFTQRNQP